jgi:tyrosyl-DNA phosphodiesterase-1
MESEARPEKRRRLDELQGLDSPHTDEPVGRPISPPILRRAPRVLEATATHNLDTRSIPSPFRLSRIRDASTNDNVDAVHLHDLVGSPLVKECWHFNFLFDVDFVMYALRSFSIA